MNLIYDREPIDGTGIVQEIKKAETELEDFKSAQSVGGDSLVVYYYTTHLEEEFVAGGATAVFEATFTFDDPPVISFVHLTYIWFANGVATTYFDQEFDNPSTLESTTMKKRTLRFSPFDPIPESSVVSYCKSTAQGTLSLVRLA